MPDRTQNRISAINSPHELALGVAFGVVIGLMPKDSVIPWALGLLFLLSRANILCGIMSAIAFSAASPLLDGIFDRMGATILTLESLQTTFASWMEISWVSWTRFNNTVVAGSFAVGMIASLPVYLLSQVFFRVWGIPVIERVMQTRLMRFLFGDSESDSTDSSLLTET